MLFHPEIINANESKRKRQNKYKWSFTFSLHDSGIEINEKEESNCFQRSFIRESKTVQDPWSSRLKMEDFAFVIYLSITAICFSFLNFNKISIDRFWGKQNCVFTSFKQNPRAWINIREFSRKSGIY